MARNIDGLRPYQPGHPGGPGRPKGSRAKLSELAASLLYENFSKNGAETIERVRLKRPEVYLASVIALLPKQAQKVESPFVDISDAELEALEQHLAVVRAKLVQNIEHDITETAQPSRSRVANTETDTPGKTIQNADAVIMDGEAIMDAPENARVEHKPPQGEQKAARDDRASHNANVDDAA